MKKILITLTCFSFLTVANSCKKCKTCSNILGTSDEISVCKEDFANDEEYKLALKQLEDSGAKCK
jgi:hypothetical protein